MSETPDRAKEFFISAGDKTEGPFDVATLRARVASGEINARYQVWDESAQRWAPFAMLEPLLRPADAAPTARKGPVRSPRASMSGEDGRPPAPNDLSPDGDTTKELTPRQVPNQRPPAAPMYSAGGSSFALRYNEDDEDDDSLTLRPMFGPSPGRRQRNYSPSGGGGRVNRPFSRPSPPPPEPKVETGGAPSANAVPAVPFVAKVKPPPLRRHWSATFAIAVSLCALLAAALYIGDWVRFGRSAEDEIQRLTDDLADAQKRVADRDTKVRSYASQVRELTDRFIAAQNSVRNLRVTVLAATRRELQAGNRTAVDERLFELERLNQLANESESDAATRRELTEAFFAGAQGAAVGKPSPAASPSPSPAPSPAVTSGQTPAR